eukprot:scaffold94187_cov52-Attheya_sp.AAC.2
MGEEIERAIHKLLERIGRAEPHRCLLAACGARRIVPAGTGGLESSRPDASSQQPRATSEARRQEHDRRHGTRHINQTQSIGHPHTNDAPPIVQDTAPLQYIPTAYLIRLNHGVRTAATSAPAARVHAELGKDANEGQSHVRMTFVAKVVGMDGWIILTRIPAWMYANLVDRCFAPCITTFRSKSLDKSEASCVEACASRYVKMTQRVGLRFAEHQALQQKRAADQTAPGGN